MNLLDRLLRLHGGRRPTEDAFTEALACLFSARKDLCIEWAADLLDTSRDEYAAVDVITQDHFGALLGHAHASRPDLALILKVAGQEARADYVMIESKIGSNEKAEQLRTYAEQLAAIVGVRNRRLVYVTRDFDPKNAEDIERGLPGLRFKQLRWFDVHRFLARQQPQSELLTIIRDFMEGHRMSRPPVLTGSNLVAMEALPTTLRTMSESLWGEVAAEFKRVMGSVTDQRSAMAQLLNHNRYIAYRWMDEWWCGVGYFFDGSESDEGPCVGLIIETSPKAAQRGAIIQMMKQLPQIEWESRNLHNPREWSSVRRQRPVRAFMGGDDFVADVEKYLVELISELRKIKDEHPALPWSAAADPSEIEEGDSA